MVTQLLLVQSFKVRVLVGLLKNKDMKDGIQVTITQNGKTKTTTMDVAKWLEERDGQFGVAPLDEVAYDMLKELS